MYVCGVCGAYATGTGGAEVGSAGTSAATAQQMQRAVPAANAVLATSAAKPPRSAPKVCAPLWEIECRQGDAVSNELFVRLKFKPRNQVPAVTRGSDRVPR